MPEDITVFTILFFIFLVPFLVFFALWRRQVTIRDDSKIAIEGTVVGYKTFQRIHTPKVEYFVDGRRYLLSLKYYMRHVNKSDIYFTYSDEEELKREILKDRFVIYANRISYNYKKHWPIGSKMTVYYNPKNPKLGYVERYGGLLNYFRYGCILLVVGWIVVSIVFSLML